MHDATPAPLCTPPKWKTFAAIIRSLSGADLGTLQPYLNRALTANGCRARPQTRRFAAAPLTRLSDDTPLIMPKMNAIVLATKTMLKSRRYVLRSVYRKIVYRRRRALGSAKCASTSGRVETVSCSFVIKVSANVSASDAENKVLLWLNSLTIRSYSGWYTERGFCIAAI